MTISTNKGMAILRAVALALLFGAFLSGPAVAQEAEPALLAQVADPVVEEEEDEDGFWDWGLLGLLGLLGLAGLKKQEPEVREVPVAPSTTPRTTTVERDTTVVDRDETVVRARPDDDDRPTAR